MKELDDAIAALEEMAVNCNARTDEQIGAVISELKSVRFDKQLVSCPRCFCCFEKETPK